MLTQEENKYDKVIYFTSMTVEERRPLYRDEPASQDISGATFRPNESGSWM